MISNYRRILAVLVMISVASLFTMLQFKGQKLFDLARSIKPSRDQSFPWQPLTKLVTLNVTADANQHDSRIYGIEKNMLNLNAISEVGHWSPAMEELNQLDVSGDAITDKSAITRPFELNTNNGFQSYYNESRPFLSQRNVELRKVLQAFEEWKVQYKDTIGDLDKKNRNLLPPPPHVHDALMWGNMIQMFPLVFQRLMKPFLLEYKNPCFLQFVGKATERKCLPYFIEIGAAKCGSTDLYFHITRHPQIVQLYKEPHFWTHMQKTDLKISHYLDTLGKFNRTAVTELDKRTLIFGDASPSYFWEQTSIPKVGAKRTLPFVWADVIHAVLPGTKIIAVLRNPTNRTISDYFYSGKHQSPQDFDRNVKSSTKKYNKCQETRPLRECGTWSYYPRLHISVYIAFIQEWLRVFPREQVMIIRTEDWHNHENNDILKEVYKFLEIDELSESELPVIKEEQILKEIDHVKATEKKSKKLGYVLPETRALLDRFFEPYNKRLADFLRDEKFLWKDLVQTI